MINITYKIIYVKIRKLMINTKPHKNSKKKKINKSKDLVILWQSMPI